MRITGPPRHLVPVAVAGLLVVQLLALYLPQDPGAPSPIPHGDKLVHAVIFGAPVLVAGLAKGRWWLLVALACAVHGPVSEVIQQTALPSRSGDVWDAVADLVGTGAAVAGVRWGFRRPRRRRL